MRKKIVEHLTSAIINHPGKIALLVLLLVSLAGWKASQLHINYNQLELIPQDLPSVKATKRMAELAGGYGNLYIVLRSDNLGHMKQVADEITARLNEIPEVKKASCRQDVSFLRKHLAYLIDYEDLKEAYGLMRKKIRIMTRAKMGMKADSSEVDKELNRIVDKYRSINTRYVDDKYHVDPSKKLLMITISARGIPNDLDFSGKLLSDVQGVIDTYNKKNSHHAVLVEKYGGEIAKDATVTYGITGEYKITYEDSMQLQRALAPVSLIAFLGILFYLIIILRKPTQIVFLMSVLVLSLVITFGFTRITLGELNSITAILGAILMGFGIDFGIHFIYRLREEYSHRLDLEVSIQETLYHSGMASLISAFTSASSLFVLVLADFKGFSHFGLIAGVGVIVIAFMMYLFIPVLYVLIDKKWPGFKKTLIVDFKDMDRADLQKVPFPHVGKILAATLVLTVFLAVLGTRVQFDYDSRTSVTGNTDALILQDEIEEKFGIKGLPSVVYTENLEQTRKLFQELKNKDKYKTVQHVLSIFTIVPSMKDQMKTRMLLDQIKMRMELLPEDLIEKEEEKKIFELVKSSLEAQPYTMADVPDHLLKMFRPSPESGEDGYFTLIIPKGSVTDSKQTIVFTEEVGAITVDGKKLYSTGHMILMANLASIVIRDGKIFPVVAIGIILIIILISYRDPRALVFAMVPLMGGMLWMLGLMSLFDWKINYMNIVVFPVVLGYGISSGIHLYNRYLESRSVMVAIRHTGAAVAGSSITTLIGWAALLVSGQKGLTSMGGLAVFGITAALMVAFTVMPALLQYAEDKKIIQPRGEG